MGRLDGRVAIVTGAGRGLGRAHALELASHGAAVVVNDLGAALDGTGADVGPAHEVVEHITEAGGRAVVSGHDIADWEQAEQLVAQAVDTFGHLDVLVNNAGILRDRTLANMDEDTWDTVVRVHLKGHVAPTRHAMAYWRDRAKAGDDLRPAVVHTSSVAGFAGNIGQAHYSAAKLAVLAVSRVVSIEGGRYGIRSNVVAPSARTRITAAEDDGGETTPRPGEFDPFDPANVSPLVAWLAARDCPADSQVFHLVGGRLSVYAMPTPVTQVSAEGRWSLDDLDRAVPPVLVTPTPVEQLL